MTLKHQLRLMSRKLSKLLGIDTYEIKDLLISEHAFLHQSRHSNPLNRCGLKCFSQSDEDGITLEIVRRLNVSNGRYAEFGVGNGFENNTLVLAALGWSGYWVGGEELGFNYKPSKKHIYIRDWITVDNIASHAMSGLKHLDCDSLDVVSLDLDGNDLYFVRELLHRKVTPKLFIVEYNAKFPPPIRFAIKYDPQHRWLGDDYFGASLCSFIDMFSEFGYTLVCCNSQTGANAFFVRNDCMDCFSDVPIDVHSIYVGPRYYCPTKYGHAMSKKVIEQIFNV